MTKRTPPGVYRTDDGKRWEAYVADHGKFTLLGVYPTIHKAVAARASYWKKRPLASRVSAGGRKKERHSGAMTR
jgi:hypothetical protein